MAVFKLISKEYYKNPESVAVVLRYITTPVKTEDNYIGGLGIIPYSSADEMIMQFQTVKKLWHKTEGVQIVHFIVSFSYEEHVSDYQAYLLAYNISTYYANGFQVVYAVHQDNEYTHIHFVVNTVNIIDGHKLNRGKGDFVNLFSHVYWCIAARTCWQGPRDRIKKLTVTYSNEK